MTEESFELDSKELGFFQESKQRYSLCGMEDGRGLQVFVVDQPTSNTRLPIRQKPLWKRVQKKLLLPLFGLVMFGLALEGIYIYKLHKRTEALFLSYHDLLHPPPAGNKVGQVGPIMSNEVPTEPLHRQDTTERPMAHLQGSDKMGQDGVVQWVKNSDSFISHMGYNSSGLVIKGNGFYYLYSKVHIEEKKECAMVNHKVIRNTTKYGLPLELMKSASLHCRNRQKNSTRQPDLWNSFLAGVFELETGDHIFVTLDKGLYAGPADNFFGAFKII